MISTDAPGDHHAKGAKVPASVTDINTARTIQRDPDERRLIAASWSPKERCGPLGLTIWANPETGFYSSRDAALHRLDNPLPRSPYWKLAASREAMKNLTKPDISKNAGGRDGAW